MQNETNWLLEAVKVLSPIVSAFVLGIWIYARNEKLRNELAKDLTRFQTRDALLHQKQAEAIEQIYSCIARLQHNLLLAGAGLEDRSYEDVAFKRTMVMECLGEATKVYNELEALSFEKEILLDRETSDLLVKLIDASGKAKTRLSKLFLGQDEPDSVRELTVAYHETLILLNKSLLPLKSSLEDRFREILSPLPADRIARRGSE